MFLRVLLLCLLLAGCGQTAAPVRPLQPEAHEAWPEGGRLAAVDAARSRLQILVFRAGTAAALGHNHVLTAPRLQGWLWTPEAGLEGARFALRLRLDELELDAPEFRASLGPDFASHLDAEAIAGTRAHMLGPDNLEADRYPVLQLRSASISGQLPQLQAEVEIELHGQRRRQLIALEVWQEDGVWRTRGDFTVRQSNFGVRPYSVLGGLLAVQDELKISFDILSSAPRTAGR